MKLTDLLDQIDRLDGELLPDWKYNDRTGAVLDRIAASQQPPQEEGK